MYVPYTITEEYGVPENLILFQKIKRLNEF